MDERSRLLLQIANCDVASAITAGKVAGHACQSVVKSQDRPSLHVPEPWVGRIDEAPILFISSNPSYDKDEQFPIAHQPAWTSTRIIDFFENRFTSSAGWVRDLKVLHVNGAYSKNHVRFWAAARSRSAQILQKENTEILPGVDFAMTELVHCKSAKERGVSEALDFCMGRYFESVMRSAASAKVIVIYGAITRKAISGWLVHNGFPLPAERIVGPLPLFGLARMLGFLPAPASWGGGKSFSAEEATALCEHLRKGIG